MQILPLDPESWPALSRVLGMAFGIPAAKWDPWRERMGDQNLWLIRDDKRILGGLGAYPIGQCFGGRVLRMAGVAGVGVAPDVRGQDVARRLLGQVLREQRERGVPLAALYASTQNLYRKLGFELSGNRAKYTVPLSAIGRWPRVSMEEVLDATLLKPRLQLEHGNLSRVEALWQRILLPRDGEAHAFLLGDDGYVVYKTSDALFFDVELLDFCVPSVAAMQGLLAFAHDQRSMATNLRWFGPANDPLTALLPEAAWKIEEVERWLLRIVDLKAALEGRGWLGRDGVLHLEVVDEVIPENRGRWILEVHQGEATVTAGGRGDLRAPIRGLAPLYSGLFDAPTLARMGWIEGDPAALRTAAALFLSPEPWMREHF